MLVLDGTTTFPLVSSTVRFLRMYHDISPVAVVGVGYPDVVDMVSSMPERTRDLTPSDGREWWHGHFLGHPRRPALCRLRRRQWDDQLLPGETHKSSVPAFTVAVLRHLYGRS